MLMMEMCSASLMMMWSPLRRLRSAYPTMPRLLASVAPAVKTISRGSAPKKAATWARASSRATVATSPTPCSEAALPNFSVKYGSIASTTRGSTGLADW